MKVLITGATGALGNHVAERFLKDGHEVVGTFNSDADRERGNPKASWIQVDLSSAEDVKKKLGGLSGVDALIHCAGGFRWTHADQVSDEDLDFLINANLKSAFLLVREIIPGMKKRNFGRIVFVGARATLNVSAGMGPYAASKAGLNALTSALAEEVKSHDINVNAVLPTIIDTPTNRKDMPQADVSAWVSPVALADIIYSLTQPWGNPIHGALIPVSGRV